MLPSLTAHVCARPGNYDVLALRNCYHGMSEGTMGVTAHSTWKFNVPQVHAPLCFLWKHPLLPTAAPHAAGVKCHMLWRKVVTLQG